MLDLLLFAGPTDPDVAAWAAKSGGASGNLKAKLSAYVRALKAAGVWQVMGRHFIRGAETPRQALTCLVTRTSCTAQNFNLATQFKPFHGLLGDGIANYIDWNVTPAAIAGFTLNAAHISQYVDTLGALNAYVGSGDGVGQTFAILPQVGPQSVNMRLNASITANTTTVATTSGLWIADRISSSQVVGAINGTDIQTLSSTSESLSATSITELAENGGGTARFFTDARVFASSAGGSLGASGRAAYAAAINAFAKSIGQGGF